MAEASTPATAAASRICTQSNALVRINLCPRFFRSLTRANIHRSYVRSSSMPAEGPVKSEEQARDRPVSVWDSNAEGVRGRWTTSRSRSAAVEEQLGDDAPKTEDAWKWWIPGPDDDAYAYEDGSDDEEDDSFLSWLGFANLDVMSVISMLKWMIPAAAIFLPWFFGGPMLFMATFAFFPWVQKIVVSFLKLLWPGRNRRRQGSSSNSNERKYSGFWKWMREDEFVMKDYDEESVNAEEQISRHGDWGDFDEDFLMLQKINRGNVQTGLVKRKRKKAMPLLVRLVVALFPFLRTWGGFL